MLKIIVFPSREKIITADRKIMQVYPLFTEKGERLQDRTDFAGIQDVEISVLRWFWPFRALKLNITSEVKKGIVEFLYRYHARQNLSFDCYSFVRLVYDVDRKHRTKFMTRFWKISTYRWWRRKIGDVVFLIDFESNYFHHAAIYIGFGLFLSVYGAGGDLEVATLKDMMRDYGARAVVSAVPRH